MSHKRKHGTFDTLELLVISFALVAFTYVLTRNHISRTLIERYYYFTHGAMEEADELRQRYGPEHYSAGVEEWIIRDFFQDRRGGFFVDVGAHHYLLDSNTFFLEAELEWSGIAIDALEEFAKDYTRFRPRTKFFALFVSDRDAETATLFVPEANKLIASSSYEFTVERGEAGVARSVPTTTLNAVLESQGVQRIDLLSMDIELSEPKALAGFDLARYRPSLVCIESHAEVRQQILDYFDKGGYRLVGKYLRMDPNNLYFTPGS